MINFISSKDSAEIRTLRTKSNNIEIIMGSETDEIIIELFESLLQKYQEGLEKKWEEVSWLLIVLVYCTIILIK